MNTFCRLMQIPKWMRIFLGWILLGIGLPLFITRSRVDLYWEPLAPCCCSAPPLPCETVCGAGSSGTRSYPAAWRRCSAVVISALMRARHTPRQTESHPSQSRASLSAPPVHRKRNSRSMTKIAADKFRRVKGFRHQVSPPEGFVTSGKSHHPGRTC